MWYVCIASEHAFSQQTRHHSHSYHGGACDGRPEGRLDEGAVLRELRVVGVEETAVAVYIYTHGHAHGRRKRRVNVRFLWKAESPVVLQAVKDMH